MRWFTPGPWRFRKDKNGKIEVLGGRYIVHADKEPMEQDESNARLISQAPAMYELLERHLLLGLDYLPPESRELVKEEFRAVLAAARGETE